MSPGSPSTTHEPLVRAGEVLAGRYRLLCPVPGPADAVAAVWQAEDGVLARPVAVKVLGADDRPAAAFLQAATRAGAVEADALTRVYDAAVEPRGQRPALAYVISEWVDGERLAGVLAGGPLPPAEALELALQAAGALAVAHAAGVTHGRLHPGNVLVATDGHLRLTDAEVAAALHAPAGAVDDVRDLGALLYALLTARWPDDATGQPGRGVPAAPRSGEHVCSPRQVRAGVPRALDAVVMRVLHPGAHRGQPPLDTAVALLTALEASWHAVHREAPHRAPGRPGPVRRLAPWVVGAALLVVLGMVCYSLGLSVGEVPPLDQGLGSVAPAGAGPSGAPPPVPVDLGTVVVRDFDPYGTPPSEKPDQVVNAHDGEPSTAWPTDLYRTERFGGLKPGVGLLLDLGAPTDLAEVDVDLTTAGASLELRAGDGLGADQTSLPLVATDDSGKGVARMTVPPGGPARYWLVWITRLPPDGGQFRAGVDELRLLRR